MNFNKYPMDVQGPKLQKSFAEINGLWIMSVFWCWIQNKANVLHKDDQSNENSSKECKYILTNFMSVS